MRKKPRVGDVVQLALPNGRYAYGRVLRDANVAFYRATTGEPGCPPLSSRDYQFVVGVYEDVVKSEKCPIVGHDPSTDPEDDWPPPQSVRDPISGRVQLYHKGALQPSTETEVQELEPAAVWDYDHLVARLVNQADPHRRR